MFPRPWFKLRYSELDYRRGLLIAGLLQALPFFGILAPLLLAPFVEAVTEVTPPGYPPDLFKVIVGVVAGCHLWIAYASAFAENPRDSIGLTLLPSSLSRVPFHLPYGTCSIRFRTCTPWHSAKATLLGIALAF
jgi:hypothetical protein